MNEEQMIQTQLNNFKSKVGVSGPVNYTSVTCPIDPGTVITELNTKKNSVAPDRCGFSKIQRKTRTRFGSEKFKNDNP